MRLLKKVKSKFLKLKVDRYRKFIHNINLIDFYEKRFVLVCNCVFFHGYSIKLLKEYFCSKSFEIYNYTDNFDFLMISSKNQNYLYNYKSQNSLNKNILLIILYYNHEKKHNYKLRQNVFRKNQLNLYYE